MTDNNTAALPWREWFKQRIGWTEFDDDKELSKGWVLTKNCKNYTTVIGNDQAWCGMSLASALNSSGYSYPVECEAAASYRSYGTAIDFDQNGIPLGAIVVIKHISGSYHVTTANRIHKAGEKVVEGLGGNQSNSINVTTFQLDPQNPKHDTIAAVRWPAKADGTN